MRFVLKLNIYHLKSHFWGYPMNHFHLQFSYNYPARLGTVEDVLNAWWTEKIFMYQAIHNRWLNHTAKFYSMWSRISVKINRPDLDDWLLLLIRSSQFWFLNGVNLAWRLSKGLSSNPSKLIFKQFAAHFF